MWYTHLDIQRDGSHKLLPRYSPSVEIAEVTFSICSGDWAKEDFEVPKSHAMYNPNLLTLEREEYHWNKLYMTENYIVYLASLIYWLQAFFLSHSIQTSTNATWTTRDVNTFVPTMKEALTVNVERDLN